MRLNSAGNLGIGTPSPTSPATQMKKDGINLAEMNIRLLQKVEELTLYLIEQNKVIQAQSQSLDEQMDRIDKLERSRK